jgi:hypothetical protein
MDVLACPQQRLDSIISSLIIVHVSRRLFRSVLLRLSRPECIDAVLPLLNRAGICSRIESLDGVVTGR